jgi:Methyltransferase FkbM domain
MPRFVSYLKGFVVPQGRARRTVRAGILKGISFELDLTSQTQVFLGMYEREIYRWFKKLSPGIQSAVDVGANSGLYTLYFLVKTKAKVWAIEPLKECRDEILRNCKANRVTLGRLQLIDKYVNFRATKAQITLDTLLPKLSFPCLIKMDIDGPEAEVLKGAEQLLQTPQVYWIIETHSEALEAECKQILESAGYETKIVPHAWWRLFLPELRPKNNRWLIGINPRAVPSASEEPKRRRSSSRR